MIDKYKDFILNESSLSKDDIYDIKQICSELIDDYGFDIEEITKRFANDSGLENRSLNNIYKYPFISIRLFNLTKKENISGVEEDSVIKITSAIYECVNKLSDIGEATLQRIEFLNTPQSNNIRVDIRVMLNEESEVSTKLGFYEFTDKLESHFMNHHNKVTKCYSIEIGNGFVTLIPNDDTTIPTIGEVKSFLSKKFSPYNNLYPMSKEFVYMITNLGEGKLNILYRGYYNLTRNRRDGNYTIYES